MAEYLGVAAHPHIAPAEIILEAAIDPLGGAALVVAHLLAVSMPDLIRRRLNHAPSPSMAAQQPWPRRRRSCCINCAG
jgi:hypothetical protein